MSDPDRTTRARFDGPAWHAELPLRLRSDVPASHSNEHVLRSCLALDDLRDEPRDDREKSPDLARLETKMDLVLDLLGLTLAQSLHLPDPVPCILQRGGISWQCHDPLPGDAQKVTIELYPDTRYPRALILPVHIARLDDAPPRWVTGHFEQIPDEVLDALEKLIFRHHRRAIAQSRRRA